jgi:hypothetical protein
MFGVVRRRAGRDDVAVERTACAGDRRDRDAVPGDDQLFTGVEGIDEGRDVVGEACYVDAASLGMVRHQGRH